MSVPHFSLLLFMKSYKIFVISILISGILLGTLASQEATLKEVVRDSPLFANPAGFNIGVGIGDVTGPAAEGTFSAPPSVLPFPPVSLLLSE